jgi:CBS domain-containing protein
MLFSIGRPRPPAAGLLMPNGYTDDAVGGGACSWPIDRIGECHEVDKVMHRDVEIIGPKESLRNAAAMMKKLDAGVLPVDEHDKLVGMITDRDIAIRGIAEGRGPDATVREVMSQEVKYCFEDEEAAHVIENMAELQVRRLPVMNRDKRLVGIVSLGDLANPRLAAENCQGPTRDLAAGRSAQPEPCSLTKHGYNPKLSEPRWRSAEALRHPDLELVRGCNGDGNAWNVCHSGGRCCVRRHRRLGRRSKRTPGHRSAGPARHPAIERDHQLRFGAVGWGDHSTRRCRSPN